MGITDPAQEYFKDGGWGWTGTAWVKLGLLWGYYDRLAEDLGDLNPGAGSYTKYSTAVPAGEVHVIRGISYMNNSGARGALDFRAYFGALFTFLYAAPVPGASTPHFISCDFVLKEGDRVRVNQASVVAGDDIYSAVWGYKMKVA